MRMRIVPVIEREEYTRSLKIPPTAQIIEDMNLTDQGVLNLNLS
jgi:hypothetical protein